ncbi:hypothetical protein K3495_g3141 [Podosphaera aphanis]|nr:hypothetical protein K3495_g3141 [Podosphaera aphanis]
MKVMAYSNENPNTVTLDSSHLASEDEDDLIASLEDDESASFSAFREQRIQQLHDEFSRAKAQRSAGYGSYTEIHDEKTLMDLTTSCRYAVVHFFKQDFARCGVMDAHLETLSKAQYDTRFLKISVENAPFLVTKLSVRVLPCVICWVDGMSVDRLVGFEGLGYTPDTFTTKDLETRFLSSGVVQKAMIGDSKLSISWTLKKEKNNESEDDDDWD